MCWTKKIKTKKSWQNKKNVKKHKKVTKIKKNVKNVFTSLGHGDLCFVDKSYKCHNGVRPAQDAISIYSSFVAEVSVSQRSEMSDVDTSSPARRHHVAPTHVTVSATHQSPERHTASPERRTSPSVQQSPSHLTTSSAVHQSVPVSVAPMPSSSSPVRHRPSLTPSAATVVQEDPASCPIIPGRKTTIEINKGKSGLGLSIIGGSDTLLVGVALCSF